MGDDSAFTVQLWFEMTYIDPVRHFRPIVVNELLIDKGLSWDYKI